MDLQSATTDKVHLDIHTVGREMQVALDLAMAAALPTRQAEFDERFARDGDMAYGALNTILFQPVRRYLSKRGLKASPRLPGDFQDSREWGNDDETHQQRWMWSLILGPSGNAIGTIAIGSHHDHSRFRLPRSPEVLSLTATTWEEAIKELEARLPKFANQPNFKDWYRDYLESQEASG